MSNKAQDFWNDKLTTFYKDAAWSKKPNAFVEEAVTYFPKKGNVLELGTGRGQDAKFFAENGYEVTATDFSDKSLEMLSKDAAEQNLQNLSFSELNLLKTFPFKEKVFDIVYAHLSLHYFTKNITTQIFSEISRVLKDEGTLALLVNSVYDHEYGQGKIVEEDYFELGEGNSKRFFSVNSIQNFTKAHFKTLLCDEQGTTIKDNILGNSKLIRYIGTKV